MSSRDELKLALTQLAGGLARPLHELREDLLNLLADVEAGLDFTDEDIQFVEQYELLQRLTKGLALVTLVRRQIDQRAVGGRPFRVVLGGRPNAGKSSLFNTLAGKSAALVSAEAGTTRDYDLPDGARRRGRGVGRHGRLATGSQRHRRSGAQIGAATGQGSRSGAALRRGRSDHRRGARLA